MTFSREIVSSWLQRINVHRSAPALFFCFDRVVIFICTSLSAEITAHVLGVWKSSLPRSGEEQEAAVGMHSVSRELSVGAEAVGLVVSMGAWWRSVRVSAHSQTLLDVLGLVAQGALPGALRMLMWFGGNLVLVARCGHPVVQRSQFWMGLWLHWQSLKWSCCCPGLLMSAYLF